MGSGGWKFVPPRLVGAAVLACGLAAPVAQAATESSHVAYTGTLSVLNGGTFPSTIAPFNTYFFHQVTRAGLSLAALGAGGACGAAACDTLLLNVASGGATGLACNVNGNLTAQQKADIVTFVSNGGKLIIYDSECSPQNYSWLPFPFTTSNPGAQGATGTVNIVEDNALSSTVPADPTYINAVVLATGTDAIGDMNVMTTFDANWCLDMSGTNVQRVTGPVHTYARHGAGLIIYNGMDVDYLAASTLPGTTFGRDNLSKIWLQELQVPFNPTPLAALPCGVAVIGISITPLSATNDLSLGQNTHTVTGTLKDLTGTPEPGHLLTFTVLSGPNAGATGVCAPINCITPASGQVTFTYSSNSVPGTDAIKVCTLDNLGAPICSQSAQKEWKAGGLQPCDVDRDGDIDKLDLALISRARGQQALPGDPRDADADGVITPNDVKVCLTRCTRAACATP